MAEFNPSGDDPNQKKGFISYADTPRPVPEIQGPPGQAANKGAEYAVRAQNIRANAKSQFNAAVSDLFGDVVKAADWVTEKYIQNSLTEKTDTIRDEYGVGAMAAWGAVGTGENEPTIPQLDVHEQNLQKLTQGYQDGRIRESQYWARLESMTRQMKTRFPGYRDRIDSMVSKLTGATPANVLRDLLHREAVAAGDSAADAREKVVKHGLEQGWLFQAYPNWEQLEAQGKGPSTLELQGAQGRYTANEAKIDSERKLYAARKDAGEANEHDLINIASRENYTNFTNKISRDIGAQGFSLDEAINRYTEMAKTGQPIDGKELQALSVQFAQFQQEIERDMANNLATRYSGQEGLSIQGKEKQDATKHQVREILKSMESAFKGDGDASLIAYNLRLVKAQKDEALARMVEKAPATANVGALREIYGDTAVSAVLLQNNERLSEAINLMNTVSANKIMAGESNFTAEIQAISAEKGSKMVHDEVMNLIDRHIPYIMDDKMTVQQKNKAINQLFHPDNRGFMARLPMETRMAVFHKFTSPDVQAAMIAFKNSGGDPQAWTRYENWVRDSARVIAQKHAADISAQQRYGISKIVYDEPNNKLIAATPLNSGLKGRQATSVEMQRQAIQRDLDVFNQLFASLAPVMQAGSGQSPEEEMQRFLREANINLGTEAAPTIAGAVHDALDPSEEEDEEGGLKPKE
jgi:hypothetical protein